MNQETERRINELESTVSALRSALLCVGFSLPAPQRERLAALLRSAMLDSGIRLDVVAKGAAARLLDDLENGEEWLGLLPEGPR